jgi:hypothetical protein
MARRGSTLVVALAVTLLAACSSSSNDATPPATTTPTPAPTSLPPTTPPPPTATSTPSTTTEPPPTTPDPSNALAAQVEADFRETIRLTNEALQDPTNDEKVAFALEGYIETNRAFIEDRFEEFRSNGWVATPSPSVEADLIVEEPARLIAPSTDVVEIQVCEIDPWIVVEPGAGPDGTDAIVDAELYTYRSIFFLRNLDGRWRAEGSRSLGQWTGLTTCPAE